MCLFRYPGSKSRILSKMLAEFPHITYGGVFGETIEYREPFFGAGAVGFQIMQDLHPDSQVWINDMDPGIVAVWAAVQRCPDELKIKIRNFTPSVEAFQKFKGTDGSRQVETVERGFRKIALHQMSMSGFGARAGGPIGGIGQKSQYPVTCRWNPKTLCKTVDELHHLFQRFTRPVKITEGDFMPLLVDTPERCFVYMDPPYVEQGPAIYKHYLDDGGHSRLAEAVRTLECQWALSYDDHPLVRTLYDLDTGSTWARSLDIFATYTNAVARGSRPAKKELLILPPAPGFASL